MNFVPIIIYETSKPNFLYYINRLMANLIIFAINNFLSSILIINSINIALGDEKITAKHLKQLVARLTLPLKVEF